MDDMMKIYRVNGGTDAGFGSMPVDTTLILNSNSSLVKKLGEKSMSEGAETAEPVAKQIYTLALLAQRQLSADELQGFLYDSFSILENNLD
jgi:hypothetical protein